MFISSLKSVGEFSSRSNKEYCSPANVAPTSLGMSNGPSIASGLSLTHNSYSRSGAKLGGVVLGERASSFLCSSLT